MSVRVRPPAHSSRSWDLLYRCDPRHVGAAYSLVNLRKQHPVADLGPLSTVGRTGKTVDRGCEWIVSTGSGQASGREHEEEASNKPHASPASANVVPTAWGRDIRNADGMWRSYVGVGTKSRGPKDQ